jgi:hypothetical protein
MKGNGKPGACASTFSVRLKAIQKPGCFCVAAIKAE